MTSFKSYPDYKPSKLDWFDEIPAHWKTVALHFVARLKSGESITALQFNEEGEYPVYGGNGFRGNYDRFTHDGDYVLIGRQGALCGNINIATGKFFASEHAIVVNPDWIFDTNWMGYQLLTMNLNQHSVSAAQPGLSAEVIGRLKIAFPLFNEQQAIARFLDFKAAQIDALIAKQKTLLDKLAEKRTALISHAVTKGLDLSVPMKESGVAWLGEIPENWDVWKVTHGFGKIGSGTTPKSDNPIFYDGTIPWVTTSELRESVIFDTVQKVTGEAVASHSALKIYPAGSLAIAMYGATIGRLGILGVEATFNQACCVFSDPTVFDTRFVYYWLWMRRPILISLSNGGGQPNLSQDDLKKIWIPVPGLDEQRTIVRFLDAKTAKVDEQVKKVENVIAKLLEYRSSLITNAVTGKIDVRGFEIPQPAVGLAS